MPRQLFALVTDQGTACEEACLCSKCLDKPGSKEQCVRQLYSNGRDVPDKEHWHECTDNEALKCSTCGWFLRPVVPCIIINAPHWFERADFQRWLSGPDRPATWHKPGEPTENSDVFITYDHGEGSDFETMPEDIWENVRQICEEQRIEYGLIWLQNLVVGTHGEKDEMEECEYTLCKFCDHFVDADGHLEDGEQEFDHDAEPSDQTQTLGEWRKLRTDLFRMHADGKVGPNSRHHSRRGKAEP